MASSHRPQDSPSLSVTEKASVGNSRTPADALNQNIHCSMYAATAMVRHMGPAVVLNHADVSVTLKHSPHQQTSTVQSKSILSLPTPIDPLTLEPLLAGYDNHETSKLLNGFREGFSLGSTGVMPARLCNNHPSVASHSKFVFSKISSEVSKGRVKGPYSKPPLNNFICSPLGVVPKKTPNSFRIIHDLSYPKHAISVNATIPRDNSAVILESFDNVASLVLSAGRGSLLAKADIEEAFRIIPISPLDYHKLGFKFDNNYYFYRVLPMGASSSVAIFETFSRALQWILRYRYGVLRVSHIIDDFIFVGAPASDECLNSLYAFFRLAATIGLPIKSDKTVLPSTVVEVHGITINTADLTASLPIDKVETLKSLLLTTMNRRKITLLQLQSVLGHLNFACKVIKPGRCFLRRLYDLTCGKSNPNHYIKLNKDCRADLQLWYSFLTQYNGCTLLTNDRFLSSVTLKLF